MKGKSVLTSLILLFTSACSRPLDFLHKRERLSSPQNAQDVGVVVEGAKEAQVADLLSNHPNARVRILNREHGLYEIFGVNLEQVRREYAGVSSLNQFFSFQPVQKLSSPAPVGLQIGNLKTCVAGEAPTAVLTVDSPTPRDAAVEIGTTIRIHGAGASKMAFAVTYPKTAGLDQRIENAETLEFKADQLGLYQVFLVVQDERNACALDAVSFIITANRPYTGPSARDLKVNLDDFPHLQSVSAQESWKLSEGEGLTIAIIDTGVDYNHPSLAGNILLNEKEIAANGVDDDGNGFVDDVLGYDFVNQDAFPYDDDSHGTHVAGLAASRQFGMARKAKILPIKALNSLGGDVATMAAAIRYAVDRGANIINLSLGGSSQTPPPAMLNAMAYAQSKGVLVVAAAGNGDAATGMGYSIDESPIYPASLKNENLVTVAAFDAINPLSIYSNFGAKSVHVVAPGGWMPSDPMFSAAFENSHDALFVGMSGTSMAAPIVSGIAAQVWSRDRGLTFQEVRQILIDAGKDVPELKPVTISGKHIDSLTAVQMAQTKGVLF